MVSKQDFDQLYFFKRNPAFRSFWAEQYEFLRTLGSDKIIIGNASQFKSIWSDPYIRSDSLEELNIISTGWYSYSPYWIRRVEMYGLNSTNLGIYGIYSAVNTAAVTQTINANTISNLNATSVGSSAEVLGIWTPGTTGGKYQITNNLVNSLNSSGAGAIVTGIYNSAATTNDQLISGNTIHSLVNTGSAVTSVVGIYYSGPITGVNEIKSNELISQANK
jgi:hypothetical protein